ncbi:MAG: hypothetical protein K0S98_2912, partial [Propionibacteriaceae bacterium]|nr:hypothetical protein [Propionibacteriaceae bacterium]
YGRGESSAPADVYPLCTAGEVIELRH